MTTTASNIRDITTAYLESFDKDKWSNVVRDYQHHLTADELFTKRLTEGHPGEKCTFNLKTDEADNTTADSFYKADSLNRTDLFRKGEVKWHFQKTHYVVDRREPAMMSNDRLRIFNYLEGQKNDMYDGFFKQNEIYMWTNPTAPNDGSAGEPLPFGVPHWIVSDGATSDVGLNGDTPSGYSSVANVNSSNVPYWKNHNFTWTSMSNSDFCRKTEDMLLSLNYRPPKPTKEEQVPDMGTFGMYSDKDSFLDYGDALYGSNENVGRDMARFRGGKPTDKFGIHYYNGIPWVYVPALTESGEAQASSPTVYYINWSTWKVESYGDLFMDMDDPLQIDSQHNTIAQWMDTGWQMYCCNRRANGVATKA